MFLTVSILIFIVALLLVLVILVQNPKGGLASNFSSSNQVMGVRKTTDFLEKATWTLGIALLILSVISSSLIGGPAEVTVNESELQDAANEMIIPQQQAPMMQENRPAPPNQQKQENQQEEAEQ